MGSFIVITTKWQQTDAIRQKENEFNSDALALAAIIFD